MHCSVQTVPQWSLASLQRGLVHKELPLESTGLRASSESQGAKQQHSPNSESYAHNPEYCTLAQNGWKASECEICRHVRA